MPSKIFRRFPDSTQVPHENKTYMQTIVDNAVTQTQAASARNKIVSIPLLIALIHCMNIAHDNYCRRIFIKLNDEVESGVDIRCYFVACNVTLIVVSGPSQ